jgi:hypothetical protein
MVRLSSAAAGVSLQSAALLLLPPLPLGAGLNAHRPVTPAAASQKPPGAGCAAQNSCPPADTVAASHVATSAGAGAPAAAAPGAAATLTTHVH